MLNCKLWNPISG